MIWTTLSSGSHSPPSDQLVYRLADSIAAQTRCTEIVNRLRYVAKPLVLLYPNKTSQLRRLDRIWTGLRRGRLGANAGGLLEFVLASIPSPCS